MLTAQMILPLTKYPQPDSPKYFSNSKNGFKASTPSSRALTTNLPLLSGFIDRSKSRANVGGRRTKPPLR
jgi:hypothetical protein